jgi:hypothetical protein
VSLATVVFLASAAFIAVRLPRPWVAATFTNAAASAGLGAAVYLAITAYRAEWGAACNQCQPIGVLVIGSPLVAFIAGLAAIPVGAVARRAFGDLHELGKIDVVRR